MQIKILGCSGGVGPGLRTTSLLVEDRILIDAGTGTGDLSLAQMRAISDIYITHSHLDHVCGLAFLADNLFDLIDRPIRIHATRETLDTLQAHLFNWKLWPDFSKLPDEKNPLITWHELKVGEPQDADGFKLTGFPVLHTVPAIGYAVEGPAGLFAFTGDTYACDDLWNSLNALPRLDSLMIDVAFTDEDDKLAEASKHLVPSLLATELSKLRHRPKLYLTHHKPGCEAIIEKQCRKSLGGWDYHHLQRGDIITF